MSSFSIRQAAHTGIVEAVTFFHTMSDPTSEPEKYTIEEMMDRLKNRDEKESDSELVIRSDGSQAMKVKKRKRRSNQAVNKETKRNQRVQVLQIAGFVILLVIVGLAAGIGILYSNSNSFRDGLIAKVASSTGAKAAFTQFRMNPATANATDATLKWPDGNVLASLVVGTVKAKIAPVSFLGKIFKGEEIIANSGELVLRVPQDGKTSFSEKSDSLSPLIVFNRYSVPRLDVYFGIERIATSMLAKTEASFFQSTVPGQGEIRLSGGLLQIGDWPPMKLDRSYIKARNSELQIESLRFMIPATKNQRVPDKGTIDFTGTIKPLGMDATHTLAAKVESFRLDFLAGPDIGRFFLGTVETKELPDSNFLTFKPGSDEAALLEMTVSNTLDSRVDVSGFKFLSKLALILEDKWYGLPNFNTDTSLVLRRRGGNVQMSSLKLLQRGLMAIKGDLTSGVAGEVKGKILIGLPEAVIAASKNKVLNKIFGKVKEDHRWLEIEISGTSAVPFDNFEDIYSAAAAEVRAASEEQGASKPDSFDNLIDGN